MMIQKYCLDCVSITCLNFKKFSSTRLFPSYLELRECIPKSWFTIKGTLFQPSMCDSTYSQLFPSLSSCTLEASRCMPVFFSSQYISFFHCLLSFPRSALQFEPSLTTSGADGSRLTWSYRTTSFVFTATKFVLSTRIWFLILYLHF